MLRWEGAHEGLSGGGPAKDSAAAEFSARLSQKPALKSSRAVFQPGSKAVTFADSRQLSAEAKPIAGPGPPGTAACRQEELTVAALKSSCGKAALQLGSKAVTFADSRLLAAELIAKPERLGTASCQQEG